MKITSLIPFHFVHDSKEEFDLGPHPVEVSDEAYNHLIATFGTDRFTIVDSILKEPAKESANPLLKKSEKELVQESDNSLEIEEEDDEDGVIDPKIKEIINNRGRPKKES